MAFQPAQRQHAPRPQSFSAAPPPPIATQQAAPPKHPEPQQEKEWILFSPDTQLDARTGTASSARTQTAGRSRLSDFGSLDTAAVSEPAADDEDDRDHEELDSLDDGLHAFNEPAANEYVEQSAETVLPTHDGLGKFPGSSSPVQEQFWQHERYNPRRRRQSLRRSSLQRRFDALDDEKAERSSEEERFQRIEQWRIEQSKAILTEIERETRRHRRRSRLSASRRSQAQLPAEVRPVSPQQTSEQSAPRSPQKESFWERVTRRVIQGLMGIDEVTLSYIFGESLPTEDSEQSQSRTVEEMVEQADREIPSNALLPASQDTWQDRLLARISKELGLLVHQISEHPGAFSTFLKAREPPSYAGLPTPPPSPPQQHAELSPASHISTYSPVFAPTLGPVHTHQRRQSTTTTADPSLWGIEEEDEDLYGASNSPPAEAAHESSRALQKEREYWEKDLDIKMVYRFLRGRLSSSSQQTSAENNPSPSTAPNNTSTQAHRFSSSNNTTSPSTAHNDSLRRQALIRHHHPLVSRNHSISAARASATAAAASAAIIHSTPNSPQGAQTPTRRSTIQSSERAPLSPILGRRQSYDDDGQSCASQSTKKSKTGHSSGGSRNYWALGGPGSVGSWGEVW